MSSVTNKIVDVANNIYDQSITSDSIAYIANFIRDRAIGQLNNLIGTNFYVDDALNYELNTNLTVDQISIIYELYEIFNLNRLIKLNGGSSAYSSISQVQSDGAFVKMVSKSEINKDMLQLRKQHIDALNNLVKSYNSNLITPLQVVGDDILSADYYSNEFNSDLIHNRRR